MINANKQATENFPYLSFMNDYLKAMEANPQYAAAALASEQFRIQMIQQLMGDVIQGDKIYSQTKDREGNVSHYFSLVNLMIKQWDDKEAVRGVASQLCQSYFEPHAEFCTEAFMQRPERSGDFLAANQSTIYRNAENAPRENETPLEKWGNSTIEVNGEQRSMAEAGFTPYMDLRYLLTKYGPPDVPGGILKTVRTGGATVGYMVQIDHDGQKDWYYAEIKVTPRNPFQPVVLWPYFFMFGQKKASEWNAYFIQRYGDNLRVDGQKMSEFLQKS